MGNLGGYCMGLLCSITGQNIVALRERRESEAEKRWKLKMSVPSFLMCISSCNIYSLEKEKIKVVGIVYILIQNNYVYILLSEMPPHPFWFALLYTK